MNKDITPSFAETVEQRQFRQEYLEKMHGVYKLHEALGLMDLGEDKKISLRDIFVPLRFSTKELSESRDWENDQGTYSLINILTKHHHLVLSGRPGSGKTTVSRMIINLLTSKALTSFTQQFGRRIPLYFKLRDYQISTISSPNILLDQFVELQSRTLKYAVSREHIEFYLQQGWCFIIFDGVDEVGGRDNRLQIRELVLDYFINFHEDNYVLVTSRPTGLENVPFSSYLDEREQKLQKKLPTLLHVDSFNKKQTSEFCQKWFALREENPKIVEKKATDFLDSIEKIKSLSVLKRRPVFLTMMAHIHTTKGKLPHSRAKAYEYMVDAYIEHIDITRRLHKEMYPDEHYYEWSFEDKIKLLEGIAYKLQCAETNGQGKDDDAIIVVSRKELLEIIKAIIQEKKEGWQTIELQHAEALLSFYLTRTGLLNEPEEERIQFSHLSFQEYLTARYMYRLLIENFFNAAEILNKEVLTRLTGELFSKWSETLLLFFSLNKAASSDILKNLQKGLKEDSEENKYFHLLVMKMLDSEEYGIKDSDLGHWTKQCVQYICTVDRSNERTGKREDRPENRGMRLIKQYFLSENRDEKLLATRDVLHELFDKYFKSIQDGEYDVCEGRCLENVLYFMLSPPVVHNIFHHQILKALPILLNRTRYDSQFLAAMELFVDVFKNIADSVADVYTIDEAMICKDLLSKSLIQRLARRNDTKHWFDVLLRWAMLLENLSIFSLIESLFREDIISEDVLQKNLCRASTTQLQSLAYATNSFWIHNWYNNVWYEHTFGFLSRSKKDVVRSRAIYIHDQKERSRSLAFDDFRMFNKAIHNKVASSINKIALKSSLDPKQDSIWWSVLPALWSANAFVYSNIELDQNGTRYDYLWKTYEELEDIYALLQEPEALYKHLRQNTTSIIEEKTFLEQYKEYDKQVYSMRNMAKTVLDRGKENYPDSDNNKIMEKCRELVDRVAIMVEQEGKVIRAGSEK